RPPLLSGTRRAESILRGDLLLLFGPLVEPDIDNEVMVIGPDLDFHLLEGLAVIGAQCRRRYRHLDLEQLRIERSLAAADLLCHGDAKRQRDGPRGPLRSGYHAAGYTDLDRKGIAVLMALACRFADRAKKADVFRLAVMALFPKAHRLGAGADID